MRQFDLYPLFGELNSLFAGFYAMQGGFIGWQYELASLCCQFYESVVQVYAFAVRVEAYSVHE